MDDKNRYRIFLSVFFFLSGFCFSTWASRIPTIKAAFNLNDAELGTVLLFMPMSSLIGLPISGWLVARFNSRIPLAAAFILLGLALSGIGFATSIVVLVLSVSLFAFSLRILNIAMNTQAITIQKQYTKKINGSFHGLWSTGGITGVGFTTLMLTFHVSMPVHLLIVSVITLLTTVICYRYLLHNDKVSSGNKIILGKPDLFVVYLGLLVFFASICEGGMFDWSGIYFKEIIKVDLFTLGYLTFMIFMALSRFASDYIVQRIGMAKTYIGSALLIFSGIALAILVPSFWPSLIGFCLVGFGTASIIPMTYMLAGTSKKYSAGMAISIIATYGIVGMFVGPPMIGYLAQAFNLKVSFIAFAFSGLMLIPVSQLFFRHQKTM